MFDGVFRSWADKFIFLSSNLRVLSQDYGLGIAEGDVPNHSKWKVIGFRSDTPSAAQSHLAQGATGRFVWPAAAQNFWVFSTSANDDGNPLGSGARTIRFAGITAAGAVATETLTLDGVTRVQTVGTYLAPVIDETYVLTAGATGWNEGVITCYDANALGNVVWAMTIATNAASGSVYYVPANYKMYLWKVACGESSNQGMTYRLHVRLPSESVFRRRDNYNMRAQMYTDDFKIPPYYPGGTRLEWTGQAAAGTGIGNLKALGWIEPA